MLFLHLLSLYDPKSLEISYLLNHFFLTAFVCSCDISDGA
jgi:hypothetical protein